MKKLLTYILIITGIAIAGSCKKYLDIDPPRTSLNNVLVFEFDKTAEAAIVGIYANMNSYSSSFANTQGNFLPSFSADDFHPSASSADADEFAENSLTPVNGNISNLWSQPYALIYQANAVIEGVSNSKSLSVAKANQVMGEARFWRAFYYFNLVNYFGDVPLILNTAFKTNSSLPKTSSTIVYDTIVQDLQLAQNLLTDNYATAERIRANKTAATALLARVFLYRGQWDKAEAEATKVLNDGRYKLEPLNNVFLKTSNEAILQLQAINTVTGTMNTWEAYSILPVNTTNTPAYIMYPGFRTSFEANDQRATSWLASFTPSGGGTTVYYPTKYKIRIGPPVSEYSMVLRRAEQFLIRAEARAQQNNLTGAKSDLDSIRLRAGITALPTGLTKDQLLLATEKERKLELFTEWGHRWFDLKRTGRALAVLTPLKPGIAEGDLLYPIPLDVLNTNPNMEQNNWYKN